VSKKKLLIESQYIGSIPYWACLLAYEEIYFDAHEHFVKASYRNRCNIATPDGLLSLSAPLKRGRGQRRKMKEVRLFEEENWRIKHWNSLCSAYRRSPYFEYFEDLMEPFFRNRTNYLLEWNMTFMKMISEMLKVKLQWSFTERYIGSGSEGFDDLRSNFLPSVKRNKLPEGYKNVPYHQVFQDRTGFFPDISVLDMLFNEGPRAADLIRASWTD